MLVPKRFGHWTDLNVWRLPTTVDELVGLRAAELQHAVCVAIRNKVEGRRIEDVEAQTGFGSKRLGKLLGGHAHLTLDDIARIELVLGPVLAGLRPHRTTVIDADLAGQFPRATKVKESFFPGIPAPRMDP